jgi:O-antigen ligase
MKSNTGNIDRAIRAILGLILIALAATGTVGVWGWIGIVIGIVLLLTAIFSFCPAYAIFGMNTCPMKKS